jgi:hypothetical protein
MWNQTRIVVVSPGVNNDDVGAAQNSKHPAGIPACCSLLHKIASAGSAWRRRGCCAQHNISHGHSVEQPRGRLQGAPWTTTSSLRLLFCGEGRRSRAHGENRPWQEQFGGGRCCCGAPTRGRRKGCCAGRNEGVAGLPAIGEQRAHPWVSEREMCPWAISKYFGD